LQDLSWWHKNLEINLLATIRDERKISTGRRVEVVFSTGQHKDRRTPQTSGNQYFRVPQDV